MNIFRDRVETYLFRGLRIAGSLFFLVLVLFPFYWMVLSSFKPLQEILLHPAKWWPDFGAIDCGSYVQVLFEHGFLGYIANSAYVAGVTVAATLALATLAAYAVTRLRFPGRSLMSGGILLIYLLPAIVLIIPLYVLFSRLGLRDSTHVLVLVYLVQTLPVALYMLRSHFQDLPPEIEYAALSDGCSRAGVIRRIVIPLSAPTLACVALYTFIIAWNEFLFAFMLLDTPEKFTLSRGVVQLAGSVHLSRQLVMAASVIATLPILLLFLLFERRLTKGLTAGALKG